MKVIFIGNELGGDDGIGPYLYKKLRDDIRLKNIEMLNLGTAGIDLVSYIEEKDRVVIVDAVIGEPVGELCMLEELETIKAYSQHDFGPEYAIEVISSVYPEVSFHFVGIKVKDIKVYSESFSEELTDRLEEIRERLTKQILMLYDPDKMRSA